MKVTHMVRHAAIVLLCSTFGGAPGTQILAQEDSPSPSAEGAEDAALECDSDINADCTPFGSGLAFKSPIVPHRSAAPVDLTGYWVSVISEDWPWRMSNPPEGNYASIPLNPEGVRVADTWNPDSTDDSCKVYGAAGLMRNPMRLHVFWENDQVLRIDTDHGVQTRQFHLISPPGQPAVPFSVTSSFYVESLDGGAARPPGGMPPAEMMPPPGMPPPATEIPAEGPPSLQGHSQAHWHESGLKVVTTNLSPGYLRKNGVPYSGNTVLKEFFDRFEVFGEEWLLVTTIVSDPAYLSRDFITSSQFKQLPDESSWNPVPCESE
jgi:hypothetical protein